LKEKIRALSTFRAGGGANLFGAARPISPDFARFKIQIGDARGDARAGADAAVGGARRRPMLPW
jgi:hypothetical protein